MRTQTLAPFLGLVLLFACGQKSETHGAAQETTTKTTPVADMQTVEIACGSCVYHMAGVDGCAPAVVIGGKQLVLAGVEFDGAHDLCGGKKQAQVAGKVTDGKYVASAVKVLP